MTQPLRKYLVWWLYAAVLAHLLAGLLLPWFSDAAILAPYHLRIETYFWGGAAPAAARAQQLWWMALFGATLQIMAVFMLALVWQADRQRDARLWAVLNARLLLWAPQDMLISAHARVWPNLVVDVLALLTLLPPLASLYRLDRIPGRGGAPSPEQTVSNP